MKKGPLFNRHLLGFSLLELMVVVVLIGGLIMIAVPSIRSLMSLDIKKEVMKIAGLSSEVYALASLSGKTHRIVFDLDEQKYWVEEKEGEVGEINPELGYEEQIKEQIQKNRERENDVEKDAFIPSFKEVEGALGAKQVLPDDVVIYGAWTEPMPAVERTGQVAIYFFSDGYTQSCFVSLAPKGEEGENAFYIALSPLTGKAEINIGEPEISDLLALESDKP